MEKEFLGKPMKAILTQDPGKSSRIGKNAKKNCCQTSLSLTLMVRKP
jgi:hypothetical protein